MKLNASAKMPVGPALARKTRNVASDQPLKTLHDPGTNETFVDRRILPKGANGKTVNPPPIKALNWVDVISQKSILAGLTLPEFSAGQKSSGSCFRSTKRSLRSCLQTQSVSSAWNRHFVPDKNHHMVGPNCSLETKVTL
jgi:hypothetical protein